jgi:hypothetical protein
MRNANSIWIFFTRNNTVCWIYLALLTFRITWETFLICRSLKKPRFTSTKRRIISIWTRFTNQTIGWIVIASFTFYSITRIAEGISLIFKVINWTKAIRRWYSVGIILAREAICWIILTFLTFNIALLANCLKLIFKKTLLTKTFWDSNSIAWLFTLSTVWALNWASLTFIRTR